MNTNCLEGWSCTKCDYKNGFHIQATISCEIYLTDDGTQSEDNCETNWKKDADVRCANCDHEATVKEFTAPYWKVACSWEVSAAAEVRASTLEEAIEISEQSEFPLPDEPDYIDGSFRIDPDMSEDLNKLWEKTK